MQGAFTIRAKDNTADWSKMKTIEKQMRFRIHLTEYVQREVHQALDKIKWALIRSLALLAFLYGCWYATIKPLDNIAFNNLYLIGAFLVSYFVLQKLWTNTAFGSNWQHSKSFGGNDEENAVDPATGQWNLHAGYWWR